MSRNSQGLYTLPLPPVRPGELVESAWANTSLDDIASALTGSLPRDGSAPMVGPLTLSNDPITASRQATSKAYVDQFMAYATGMPLASITPMAGTVVPPGFLICDGAAVSRTTYDALFGAISTTYGSGDGSTTFNIPDLRDWFIRGKSDARTVGSTQAAAFASHAHPVSDPTHTHVTSQPSHTHALNAHAHGVTDPGHTHSYPGGAISAAAAGVVSTDNGGPYPSSSKTTGISVQAIGDFGMAGAQPAVNVANAATGVSLGASGGDETRPQNVAMIYVIKAVNDTAGPVNITGITTSDANMISVDNTNPVSPDLVIHSNVAFGTVKLDGGGKVPLNQMPTGTQQMLGYFDASSGQNPSEAYPTQTFHSGDTYIISVDGSITVYDPVTLVASLTPVTAGNLLQYITGSVSNPTGWYYSVQSTTVIASQVGFTPAAGISATDVQAAIVEVKGDIVVDAANLAFTPEGSISATNTQAAIAELDSETQSQLLLKSNLTTTVTKDSNTGAAHIPAGPTIDRPAVPQFGDQRANSDSTAMEWFNGTSWAPLGGNGPAFSAYPSSPQTVTNAATTKVFFQTEEYDTASAYDATTGVFTAPIGGFYQFNAVIAINAANGASTSIYNASLFKNSVELKRGAWVVGSNTANFGVEISYIAKLNAGDAVDCRFVNGGINALATLNSSVVTYFQGCFVRAA